MEQVGITRLIDRVWLALGDVTDAVYLSTNDRLADSYSCGGGDCIHVADNYPGTGGLAGVEAVLGLGSDVIAVAWDMPFVNSELLIAIRDAANAGDADIVAPESLSPHGIEPFCAFYSVRVREPLARFLEAGGGPAHQFISRIPRTYRLPLAEVRKAGDPNQLFFSVNTPADLERARAMLLR
jgi:molybdopterin-guanine dinucleotide biosynthesis protein A